MEKVKIALTVLTLLLVVGPILGVVFVYRDNLMGLVVPPEVNSMINGEDSGNQSSFMAIAENFEAPSIAGEPQYDSKTGAFSLAVNFTNPLPNELSVEQFSADVKSKDTGVLLGTVTLPKSIDLAPNGNGVIDIAGNVDPAVVEQVKAQYAQGNGKVNVVLENIVAVVGGISVHLDQIDVGSIELPR